MFKIPLGIISLMQVDAPKLMDDIKLVVGTKQLIKDATNTLMVLAPSIAIVTLIVMAIIKMGADEQDAPRWKKRMMMVLICTIIVFVASGVINVLARYYK